MVPSNQPFTLRSILEKDKLNGTNYADWIRNLRIVLRAEKKEEILDTPLPDEPADNAPAAEKNAYKKACDADLERLEKLGFPIGPELAADFILASLPPSYRNFVVNYHMHGAEKGLNELCGMLKIAEADIKKGAGSSHVMAV
ncbi:phosphatidylinositol-3-phosphatase myotubularin-2-like [Miscanthus floridulus]|uniref:phosphatidylinositol-3-phosphatase myotubularin-2-like n=1 Tax=Miscanthus floridulus TaxID=154761 RepID=UPI0034590161